MSLAVRDLLRQYERLLGEQRLWVPSWQEIAELMIPRKSAISVILTPGTRRTEKLYDSTAIHANELLASSMQGSLTSNAFQWFALKMRSEELNEIPEVRLWLDECATRMYAAYRQSNFSAQLHELYLDLGAFGTGALLLEERPVKREGFNGLLFETIQIGEYCVAEDIEGRVDTLFRKFRMTARALASKFGPEVLPDTIQQALALDPYRAFDVLHAVLPADEKARGTGGKPWASVWIAYNEKHKLKTSGYHEFPYAVPRWTKVSGETFGRGPGFTALPDVKTLNKAKELGLKAWAKALDPPMAQLDDGVIGTARLTPGGLTTVRSMDALKPIEFRAKFDVDAIKEEELRQSIRFIFFWDQLQPLGSPKSGNPVTATEVTQRIELMQRLLGPTLGRLESELLSPIITRTFALMLRAGELPPAPEIVLEVAKERGGEIDIEYEGPLARAQRSGDLAAIERTLALAAPLTPIKPDVIDVLNLDEVVRHTATVSGVPAKLLRAPAEVEKLRAARAQAMQKEQAKADLVMGAEAAGKAAPAVKMLAEGGMNSLSQVPA